ncbi:MAG: Rne/Rng family ribonuclease [Longimicrobiaceae bacterium]
MKREILISSTGDETRVAILEDGSLVELMVDRPAAGRMVGNVYLGKVEAVLPGIQAAFVDIGTEKAGFLHASDLAWEDAGGGDDDGDNGDDGEDRVRRSPPPIQESVKKGDSVLVQVTKEPIGSKGPRLTAQLSLPGRFLVYTPDSARVGVSRKIDDRDERARLRALAREIVPPEAGGVIVRTVGEELTREVFAREYESLFNGWRQLRRRATRSSPPALIHQEQRLTGGVIRDLFSETVDSLVIDTTEVYEEVKRYLKAVGPDLLDRVRLHRGPKPLFDAYEVEQEIQEAFQRRVDLPSGGHIVIEPTEALVSIDVNTGRYTGKRDPEKTVLKTNLDAAREVARQLRLRDVGGIIVCDFIDMESQENRERVLQELRAHLGRDRARTRAFEVSELGLIEMTRQRVRASLYHRQTGPCPACAGTGRIFTPDTVARRVERTLRRMAADHARATVTVRLHPEVALHLLEEESELIPRLERELKVQLSLRDDPLMRQDRFRILAGEGQQDVTARYAVG